MGTSADYPPVSVKTLVAAWLSLGQWIARTFAAKIERFPEVGADRVKNSILDLTWDSADDETDEPPETGPRPPIHPEELAAAMRGPVTEVCLRTAQAINEDADDCWPAVTEERVLALFHGLGAEALHQAAELRHGAIEAGLPPERLARGDWASKYRRMQALGAAWRPRPSKGDGPQRDAPSARKAVASDTLADALVVAVTYILYRAEQDEEETGDSDVNALRHLADMLDQATFAEKQVLVAAARRVLSGKPSVHFPYYSQCAQDVRTWIGSLVDEEEYCRNPA